MLASVEDMQRLNIHLDVTHCNNDEKSNCLYVLCGKQIWFQKASMPVS